MAKKKVTMEELGKELNISKVTVSKALNNKEGVGKELRNTIIELARKRGYYKGTLEQNRLFVVTVVVRERYVMQDISSPTYYMEIYRKLVDELEKKGYICNMITVRHSIDTSERLGELIAQSNSSGIIILGALKNNYVESIKQTNKPIVFLDSYQNNSEESVVLVDNYYGAYKLTRYCIENCINEIGFVGTIKATGSILDRYMGYSRALIEADLPINKDWIINDRCSDGHDISITLPDNLPKAFICNCGETAYKVVKILKEKNLKVPEDISVLGFDDDVFSKLCNPELTVFAVNVGAMVEKATELLLHDIDKGKKTTDTSRILVYGNIIERNSFLKASVGK